METNYRSILGSGELMRHQTARATALVRGIVPASCLYLKDPKKNLPFWSKISISFVHGTVLQLSVRLRM